MNETPTLPARRSEANPPPVANDEWPARIEQVLARRKPYAAWLASAEQYLGALQTQLEDLAQQKEKMTRDALVWPHLEGVDFHSLARRAGEQRRLLDELGRRFRRKTLNVAVVGMINQGKSFLLRMLSGLPPTVIPDRGERHSQHVPLTGARSTIIHEANAKIRGRVIFYTKDELLTVLNSYRAELLAAGGTDADSMLAAPFTHIENFVQRPIPNAAPTTNTPVRYHALLKQLHNYKQTLVANRQFVDHEPLDGLAEGQIINYVTQNVEQKDGRGTHLHLLVKEVQITCGFPYDKVGKIALIDLPGLGEATLGGPERLWQTLRLDADVALFVWRPTKGSNIVEGNEFISLYDTCYQAMKNLLPLHEWSFLILNHDRTINDHLEFCRGTLEKIREEESLFKFFSERICDCSSPEEVRSEVLRPVLDHLAQHLGTLDRRVAVSCAESIGNLTRDASAALRRVSDAFGGAGDNWDEKEFGRIFRERWDALRLGLNNLVSDLQGRTDLPDESFTRRVESALGECAGVHRSLKAEEEQAQINRDTSYDRVFITRMIHARAEISSLLRTLDSALDQPLANVKERVVQIFCAEGGFPGLAGQSGLEQLRAWIAPHSPSLRHAFDNLIDFKMSARGLIGYKVRTKLGAMEPRRNKQEQGLPGHSAPGTAAAIAAEIVSEVSAEIPPVRIKIKPSKVVALAQAALGTGGGAGHGELHRDLDALVTGTLAEIEKALSEDYARPNQVAYAIVADFVDSVIHTRHIEDEWRNVYRNLRENVWPADYELQRQQQALRVALRVSLHRALSVVQDAAPALPTD
jgi:hypothetical protein